MLGEAGAPIAGAEVWACLELGDRRLGRTDAAGELELGPELAGRAVLVAHPAHATLRTRAPALLPASWEVALREGGAIAGQVFLPSGAPAGADLLVLAWSREIGHVAVDRREVESAAAGSPDVAHARTDAGGRFRLGGLDHQRRWRVSVAGAGSIAEEPRGTSRPAPRSCFG